MENNNYVFLADAFGYGPITTLCQIVIELKKQLKGNYIFTGPKMCISQAKKYNIFVFLLILVLNNPTSKTNYQLNIYF